MDEKKPWIYYYFWNAKIKFNPRLLRDNFMLKLKIYTVLEEIYDRCHYNPPIIKYHRIEHLLRINETVQGPGWNKINKLM